MTENDVQNIFANMIKNDIINFPNGSFISVDNFLNIVGFSNCEPTKNAMLAFDAGEKGYAALIESGIFGA